jgi:hypothetical protein
MLKTHVTLHNFFRLGKSNEVTVLIRNVELLVNPLPYVLGVTGPLQLLVTAI